MKRNLLTVVAALSCSMHAFGFTSDGINYNVNDDAVTVTVTSGSNAYKGNLVIPPTVIDEESGKQFTVTAISEDAFHYDSELTSVSFPSTISTIPCQAFMYCTSLTSFIVDESNKFYSTSDGILFSKDGKELKAYPPKHGAVYTIPNTIEKIGDYAFYGVEVTEINIPTSVRTIGNSAFSGTSLVNVTIPNSVTEIGKSAFAEIMFSLQSATLPNNLKTIGYEMFARCFQLSNIEIPSSVEVIDDYAFAQCGMLKSIIIPDNVTKIGIGAFQSCYGATELSIGNSVNEINDYAFASCSTLKSIVIPDNVTTLQGPVFQNCFGLESIVLSKNVTTLGDYTFASCSSLKSFTSKSQIPAKCEGLSPFSGIPQECILYVPEGSKVKYEADETWNSAFSKIEELPNGSVENNIIGNELKITSNGNHINISGCIGNPIEIYSTDGRLIKIIPATEKTTIQLQPNNIYILKIGKSTHKICL